MKRYITLVITLLLLGGMMNEAWADVTYHILTLPFTTKYTDGNDFNSNIRVEALRVVVKATDNNGKVGLPDKFKSPLLKDAAYHYYTSATVTQKVKIYQNNETRLDTYSDITGSLTSGSSAVSDNQHIYVTYDYNPSNSDICTEFGQSLKLDGSEAYNIEIGSDAFFCLNIIRGNRPAVLPKENQIKNIDDITSTEPVEVLTGLYNDWDKITGKLFFFRWKLIGNDPYSIMLVLDYDGDATYVEDGKTKPLKVAGDNISNRLWTKFGSGGSDNKMWVSYDSNYEWKNNTWTKKEGNYRGNNPIFESFVLLNHVTENYTLVASKVNHNGNSWQPNSAKNYMHLGSTTLTTADQLNPNAKFKTFENAPQIQLFKIKEYVFKVKAPLSETPISEVVAVSDYYKDDNPINHIPDALKRKYVTFTGAYKQNAYTNQYTSFAAVEADAGAEMEDGKKVIWLKYETSMPFTTCTKASPTYDDLTWYNFYTNRDEQYIVRTASTSFNTTGTDGSRYARTSHFAFVGDPFMMKIVSRSNTDSNNGTLHYLKLNSTISDQITQDATGTTWDIVYDDNSGDYSGCFRLREFTSTNNSVNHLAWKYGTDNYPLTGTNTQANAARLTVVDIPQKDYVYHIMRGDKSIAAKATISQVASTKLNYNSIPEIIRSPFLALTGVTLSFYSTSDDANASTNAITYAPDDATNTTQHIWVRYNMGTALVSTPGSYINGATFNVRLNGQYIYYDSGTIKSNSSPTNDELGSNAYLWHLGGSDPYAMTIKNDAANQYVTANATDQSALGWDVDQPDATKFIIKSGNNGVYEVMYATGESVDAGGDNPTYYNIGRNDTGTKMFKNTTYPHGYDQLRFQLTLSTAHDVTYHLIDKSNTELLTVVERHSADDNPEFPNEYRSPLVAQYHYWTTSNHDIAVESTIGDATNIYVTYDTSSDYDLQNKRTMYLLKYDMGENFRQEDGADDLLPKVDDMSANTYRYKAVYPYCNGDGNFFVYGQEQYDIQQQSAASTRTRWAWFLESVNNDPYHVKICSRQIETYNGYDTRAYFRTYVETFGDDTKHVVTNLSWPGISGEEGTEYMILGSTGQFRLVTSDAVYDGATNARRIVNSFEQYWKTWNTIRKKVLGDEDAVARQSDPNIVPETPATDVATAAGKNNRTYLTDVMGWHSYEQWAYAIRWNDYNKNGDKNKKGWEDLEHWFQTVNMGEGYFNLEPVTIDPVLILLDQHGWEIMRKPLPTDPNDPDKAAKYDAIRPYDSPMVKEYHFWGSAKKRTGFHQYYELSGRMKVDGEDFVSTSLTTLPDYYNSDGTRNTTITDAKGNQLDEYVTYVVKDEYVQGLGEPFMIQQGSHFASATDATTLKNDNNVPATGGMSQYIIDNISTLTTTGNKNNELWILKPNPDIDIEMGYQDATKFPGGYAHDWTNDYTKTDFSASGFDPYNIQISSVANTSSYFVTNATTAAIDEGSTTGNGATNTLGTKASVTAALSGGMDNRTLQITNATFMAVQDEDGHMQLMPRFDQGKRMKDFSTFVSPNDMEIEKSYTTLYRPQVYDYHIIDNSGDESLRYQSGGDLLPQTPEWFKSQLAKDFKYYSSISGSTGSGEITGALVGANLTNNTVYVRYSYDEDADFAKVLQGQWLTMTLNEKNAIYNGGIKQASGSKPESVNASHKNWQWKFIATPQTVPDPYAVSLYNRSTSEGTATTVNEKTKFALLNYYDNTRVDPNSFTLAVAGLQNTSYQFINGANMTIEAAATTATEANVKGASCSYTDGAKIVLTDDVTHTFTYKVYTNGTNGENAVKYGVEAVSATQTQDEAIDNDFVPVLPETIRTPLLKTNQFLYYEAVNDMGNSAKELKNLFGLYEDNVYVRYTDYNLLTTEYKVPNVRNETSADPVAKGEGSNDASLDINGKLIYNIIWYNDNMMKKGDGDAISSDASHALDGDAAYVWQFEGNDPYAIKIKHKNSGNYAVGESSLSASATSTFMLLPANDGWEYGVLAKTGGSRYQLSGYGNTLADTEASPTPETPTKFIIFGLSTHKVIYHLVIANIGDSETIPYHDGTTLNESYAFSGSTMRDLSTTYQLGSTKSINGNSVNYCVDDGHITLGDPLAVPDALYRPNCKYFFYVGGIYDDEACNTANESLNTIYKGHQITQMGTEPDLVGKTVVINIVYAFDDGLPTNNGANFVTAVNGTEWYTMETSDETPYLARFAYGGTAVIGAAEGRDPHYTNEFLWKPVGDPYGFKMYNRYVYKNANLTDKVMTTDATPANGASLTLDANTYAVYELEAAYTDGYFFMRPMLNTSVAIYNNAGTITLSSSNATEWTFGLNEAQLKPYYDRKGYVGGLNDDGVTAYENANGNLQTIQSIVYNDDYIVSYAQGYYRLHNLPNSDGITTPRYMSGYLHDIERTAVSGGIPMHFYSRKGVSTTFETLGSGTLTVTNATQGQIPVLATEYDPSSIFYLTGTSTSAQMQTQGINVIENKMGTGTATNFYITDIGGATVVIHDGNATPSAKKYLYYNGSKIYDIGYDNYTNVTTLAEKSKWCMEPANKTGLYIETHSGGEEAVLTSLWYYSSCCVPFDMLIQNKNENDGDGEGVHSSNAYTCVAAESPWNEDGLHPKPIGKYNTAANSCPEAYRGSDYFVPAGTPVLFSTRRATSYIKATIPTTSPSTAIPTIFSAKYLEQLLTGWDNTKRVYVFGPKMEGTMTFNTSNGVITAVLPSLGNTNVGFHINANSNKELGMAKATWTRNNYYVLHNKIYYRAGEASGASAPSNRAIEFVPVIFDDEEGDEEISNKTEQVFDGRVYNLQGRCVATEEQVKDGTWRDGLEPGIYIVNGKKLVITRK